MKNYLYLVLATIVAASCTKYNIAGSSDLHDVDGRMIFLKAVVDNQLRNVDSCDVVHGKFKFSGTLDSVQVVTLCIEDTPVMPVVLEDGSIEVELNSHRQICKGTALNDTLAIFNSRYQNIMTELEDLSHQQSQAIMNGEDMDVVNGRLAAREQELLMQEDKLISGFITENFDNCLGPYVFQLVTSAYEYPMLTPWIEALMTKATDTFKNAQYVKEYLEVAKQNQDIMTGIADVPQQLPEQQLSQAPTPNELARPTE